MKMKGLGGEFMDLKRNAYEQMLAWKRRGGHRTLEVSGARQVGKHI